MAVMTKDHGKEPLADDDDSGKGEDSRSASGKRDKQDRGSAESGGAGTSAPPTATGGGFFSLYKPGQGYWTRMGTAAAGALLIALLARFIYISLSTRTRLDFVANAQGVESPGFPK